LNWIFLPVKFKFEVDKKIKFIKLDISKWRIAKLKYR
jgi:hypothetical protein